MEWPSTASHSLYYPCWYSPLYGCWQCPWALTSERDRSSSQFWTWLWYLSMDLFYFTSCKIAISGLTFKRFCLIAFVWEPIHSLIYACFLFPLLIFGSKLFWWVDGEKGFIIFNVCMADKKKKDLVNFKRNLKDKGYWWKK